jgi:hypothetical protein
MRPDERARRGVQGFQVSPEVHTSLEVMPNPPRTPARVTQTVSGTDDWHRHPTLVDIRSGRLTRSLAGTGLQVHRPGRRWTLLEMNRVQARVVNVMWPACTRDLVASVAADLVYLHAMTSGRTWWSAPTFELDVVWFWLLTDVADDMLVALLTAELGDPTLMERLKPHTADMRNVVERIPRVRDRRRAAPVAVGLLVDHLAKRRPAW